MKAKVTVTNVAVATAKLACLVCAIALMIVMLARAIFRSC